MITRLIYFVRGYFSYTALHSLWPFLNLIFIIALRNVLLLIIFVVIFLRTSS